MSVLIPFLPNSKNICQKFQKDLQKGSKIDWSIVIILIKNYKYNKSEHETFLKFVITVTKLMETYHCKNTGVIGRVLEVLGFIFNEFLVSSVYMNVQISLILRRMSEIEMSLEKTYKEVHHYVDHTKDCVFNAFTSGNVGFLELLLRFGTTILPPHDDIYQSDRAMTVTSVLFSRSVLSGTRSRMRFGLQDVSSGFFITAQNDEYEERIEKFFKQNLYQNFSKASRLRVFLVFRVLEVFSKMQLQPEHAEKYSRCVKLLFSSIPEPHVSSEEVKRILIKLLYNIIEVDIVLQMVKEFECQFPDSQQPLTPRSLKHLSRCQVRENLRTTRNFPLGLKIFNLPKMVGDYILLKEKNLIFEKKPFTLTRHSSYKSKAMYPIVSPLTAKISFDLDDF